MNVNNPKTYHYIKLENEGRRYFCLQQRLLELGWVLYRNKSTFSQRGHSRTKILSLKYIFGRIRMILGFIRNKIPFLIKFVCYKYQMRKIDSIVQSPFYGQMYMPVHQGYKIFDFRKEVVVKVFDQDVPASVMLREIEVLQSVSQIEFAPSLSKWDIAGKWYEENFLEGSLDSSYTPIDSVAVLKKFQDEVVHILGRLTLYQKPAIRNATEYASSIIRNSNFSRLTGQDSTAGNMEIIKKFFEVIVDQLQKEGDCSLCLVFAHGDFVPANMLNTWQGMNMIDWEGCGSRSALYDFYSYFFYRSVSRKVPVSLIVSEIDKALPIFLTGISKEAPYISDSIRQFEKVYRWTFFVEMLCRLIDRELSDRNLNIMNYILGYIEAFTEFESLATSRQLNDSE